jgi:hypothetical protein
MEKEEKDPDKLRAILEFDAIIKGLEECGKDAKWARDELWNVRQHLNKSFRSQIHHIIATTLAEKEWILKQIYRMMIKLNPSREQEFNDKLALLPKDLPTI